MFVNKNTATLLIISTILFSVKWILSFYFFKENLSIRIIFESVTDGWYYYPFIKYIAFFEFNNSFNPFIDNLKILPVPYSGIFFHSILLKIFGYSAFIIIEFFAIFIFLLIFYKIFSYFFSDSESILLSLLLFSIPAIITILDIDNLPYINLLRDNFYSLRVPRPIIASLYLFIFLYLLISMEKGKIFGKNKFICIGIIFGFSLSSFYIFFVIEIIAFLFFLFYTFKFNFLKKIFENYKYFLLLIIFFIISSAPFLLSLYFHENDISERFGIISLDYEKKKILLNHYLHGYLKIEFLLFFLISILTVYLANIKKILNYKLINIFFILFLSCVFSPLFFVLLSNKAGIYYHFNNAIFVWAFLFSAICLIVIIKHFFKIKLNIYVYRIFIISITFLYCLNVYIEKDNKFNNQLIKDERIEFQKITKLINNNLVVSESLIMTFNNKLMVWAILNDVKYLSLTNYFIAPKTDSMIENDLIKSFKFLNLNTDDFKYFFRNKKETWRYINRNVSTFFCHKYQANSLTTFNDSKNFDKEVAKHIFSSSPTYFQQIVIPNDEFIRLGKKFENTKLQNFSEPDVIVLEKSMSVINNIVIKKQDYCKLYDGNIYILYIKKNPKIKCQL